MSDILDAVHETAKDFYQHDHISQMTLRHFDALCLTPIQDTDDDSKTACKPSHKPG